MKRIMSTAAMIGALGFAAPALAGPTSDGAVAGAVGGAVVAGPIGAVVGAVGGALAGHRLFKHRKHESQHARAEDPRPGDQAPAPTESVPLAPGNGGAGSVVSQFEIRPR
ncbi:MAG: hypothetical protein ACRED9_00890 [Caulobacteraceae bacterium]